MNRILYFSIVAFTALGSVIAGALAAKGADFTGSDLASLLGAMLGAIFAILGAVFTIDWQDRHKTRKVRLNLILATERCRLFLVELNRGRMESPEHRKVMAEAVFRRIDITRKAAHQLYFDDFQIQDAVLFYDGIDVDTGRELFELDREETMSFGCTHWILTTIHHLQMALFSLEPTPTRREESERAMAIMAAVDNYDPFAPEAA